MDQVHGAVRAFDDLDRKAGLHGAQELVRLVAREPPADPNGGDAGIGNDDALGPIPAEFLSGLSQVSPRSSMAPFAPGEALAQHVRCKLALRDRRAVDNGPEPAAICFAGSGGGDVCGSSTTTTVPSVTVTSARSLRKRTLNADAQGADMRVRGFDDEGALRIVATSNSASPLTRCNERSASVNRTRSTLAVFNVTRLPSSSAMTRRLADGTLISVGNPKKSTSRSRHWPRITRAHPRARSRRDIRHRPTVASGAMRRNRHRFEPLHALPRCLRPQEGRPRATDLIHPARQFLPHLARDVAGLELGRPTRPPRRSARFLQFAP